LFGGQSIASLGINSAITVGAIAATQLLGSPALAGASSTMFLLGTALGAYPTGRLMERYGRRPGLVLGFLVGIVGAALAASALLAIVPFLLFIGFLMMGLARGAVDQGRFAAADVVTQEHRARAIGLVVMGGTVGGIGGPLFIAPASRFAEGLGLDPLAGPFLAASILFAVGALMMFLLLRPDPREIARRLAQTASVKIDNTKPRTFVEALRARPVQTALAAMILGQVVMVTVMVMTPIQMTEHLHHTLDDVAIVIAAHVTGMYATSIITGRVADRLGHARTILIGAFILIVACVMAPFTTDTLRLAAVLFLLGAGWNFCFVAGSSLLTDSLKPNERARIQGTNDLLVGLVAATASLMSGFAFETIGYTGIALAGITLALTLFVVTMVRAQTRAQQA
jgi:MFS family permease